MQTLAVFFDYACPYCYRAHNDLVALLTQYPALSVTWNPCESHPRPERYGVHSDLCIRGMFYAQAQGVPLEAYHRRVYEAIHVEKADVERPEVLAQRLGGLLEEAAFLGMLRGSAYAGALERANAYAYEQSGVWVVPAYRLDGHALDAVEDVGIGRRQLAAFLDRAAGR